MAVLQKRLYAEHCYDFPAQHDELQEVNDNVKDNYGSEVSAQRGTLI